VPASSLDELPTVLLLEHAARNILIARPIYLADGRPLVAGAEGCSPCGVALEDGTSDLLVGSDPGPLLYFRREALRW
jgi:hypothetical protein